MTREQRLELLKQIEKDIHVCSIESTFLDDAKSCAIHSVIEELEQEPCSDAISRQEVINSFKNWLNDNKDPRSFEEVVKEMPSAISTETWNGMHGQVTAPKGTFEKIFNDAKEDDYDI